jgi:hypothetical protein
MTEIDRVVAGRRGVSLLAVASILALLLLPGCSDFRVALGMDRVGPDEFAVESRAPLTIPPDFDLRPPQPGAPRPQDVTSAERARRVIDTAGPGEPGKQATSVLRVPEGGAVRNSGTQLDPNQQVGQGSLADKLLGSADTAPAATQGRETKSLKGVY